MGQGQGTLESPAAETTIAVLLGASEYPHKPAWSNPVLGASARAFRDYVLSAAGLALTPAQVLDLFDADAGPSDQLLQIQEFLHTAGQRARDFVLYYVGHGGFDSDEYYLGIRCTRRDHEFITTIESRKLARIIRDSFGHKRVYVILDSCFAASAATDWQGDEIEVAVQKLSRPLPRQGTAFLAAASKHDVTRAPRVERYTVFTGALLDVLTRGVDREQPRLSMYELYEEVRDRLLHRETDEDARPELHVPSQREGDVSRLRLFPNAAYSRVVEAGRRGAGPVAIAVADQSAAPVRSDAAGRAGSAALAAALGSRWTRLVAAGAALAAIAWAGHDITQRAAPPSPVADMPPPARDAGGVPPPARDAGGVPSPLANPWVRVEVTSPSVLLGIDDDRAPAMVRGFRPSRKISSPPAPYDIQEHEVTWSEIEPWLGSSHTSLAFPPWAADPAVRATLPVTGVTWQIAQAYCRSLGGSLPTEEQWEYAARGAERRPNSWGAERLDLGLSHAYAGPDAVPAAVKTSPQDQTPAPAIFDLIGNAQEWTLGLWREDRSGADESWVISGPTSIRAVRGLPLGTEPPPSLPAQGAAYREQLCATGPCVDKGAELRRYVGLRCARPAAR